MPTTIPVRLGRGLLLALACLVTVSPADAWDADGHRIVARIAWDRLPASVRTEAAGLLASLGGLDFVDAGVWLDEVRAGGVHLFDRWHYINQPSKDSTAPAPKAHADNVLWAIAEARKSVAAGDAPPAARAVALAALIHLVGDVHQPLHVASRYDAGHPGGDRGGNEVLLPAPWGNLHQVWDRMGGLVRPPASSGPRLDAEAVGRWAAKLLAAQPPDAEAGVSLDPNAWADESRRLADQAVYPGIIAAQAPTAAYLERARTVAAERLVLAGVRLAAMVEAALGGSAPP